MLKLGMTAYKFELPADIFDRPLDEGTEECFIRPGLPLLPSGLTDVSPCYYSNEPLNRSILRYTFKPKQYENCAAAEISNNYGFSLFGINNTFIE